MRNTRWDSKQALMVVSALIFSFTQPANADWVDTFSGGTTDQFWQFGSDGGDPSTFKNDPDELVINDQLVLTADTNPAGGGIPTAFGVVLTEVFSDVRMTGVINPNGDGAINDSVALLLRGNLVNQSFYMAEVHYTNEELIIFRNNPGVEGGTGDLIAVPIPSLDFTDTLYVEIEAIGSSLEVWAYDYDYQNTTIGDLRATTSFDDTSAAALTSGLSGVLVNENFGGFPVLGVWDDISASRISTAIPSDFDADDDVDGQDYLEIQRRFGDTTSSQDITDWQSNYPVPLSAITAIPEPSSLALVGGLLLILGNYSRRG
ncbi:MAG: hypothetical protein ACR2NM_15295 [Bythopirellula sp.]